MLTAFFVFLLVVVLALFVTLGLVVLGAVVARYFERAAPSRRTR